MCRQLGYSKQAYYKSVLHRRTEQCHGDLAVLKIVTVRQYLPRTGVRKLYYLLKADFIKAGISMGRDKLFALLRREGLLVTRKKCFTRTTDSRGWQRQHRNLVTERVVTGPEQVWVADITFITTDTGFNYLHLVTDAYSKKIMDYHLSNTMGAEHTLKALRMAIKNRKYVTALIHHSDRGSQYCSAVYVQLLKQNNILISMTQDGSPYDNAIAERVNGILKDEFGLDTRFPSQRQAAAHIACCVKLYNNYRPHLSCSMLTPSEMHLQNEIPVKSWSTKSRRTLDSSSAFLPSHPLVNQST